MSVSTEDSKSAAATVDSRVLAMMIDESSSEFSTLYDDLVPQYHPHTHSPSNMLIIVFKHV